MKRTLLLIVFLCSFHLLHSSSLRIGIFTSASSSSFVYSTSDSCVITGNGKIIFTGNKINGLQILLQDGKIIFRNNIISIPGNFKKVTISLPNQNSSGFKIYSSDAEKTIRQFNGDVEYVAGKTSISVVNIVGLEQYVMAVVESEIGSNKIAEFLKVQSIITRTYALSHMHRHKSSGYNLCDQVHCQVYFSKSRFNKLIEAAVQQTENMILTDGTGKLITAAYHSNCGGQTVCSSDIWTIDLRYLQCVYDTFCTAMAHAAWKKTIDKSEWTSYLKKTAGLKKSFQIPDSVFCFDQQLRSSYMTFNGQKISLKKIRQDWKLNSTFFEINVSGDKIIFNGKGFGHGVGLCQEGAMMMAAHNYSYEQILDFYFSGIRVICRGE
jgi:stage II sporulation protein D